MLNNERPTQRSSTRGTSSRKAAAVNNPIQMNKTPPSQSIQDTYDTDDDLLLMEDDPDASNPPRPASSAIRYQPPRRSTRDVTQETRRQPPSNPSVRQTANVPARRSPRPDVAESARPLPPSAARPARSTTYDVPAAPKKGGRRPLHWVFYAGLSLLAAVAIWTLGTNLLTWGTNEYNTLVYGYPRTYQTDAVVGHGDSAHNPSHFIVVNLHGQIVIFEMPGSDPSKDIVYIGPDLIVPGSDQLPATLTFSDVNHDNKVDMIIHISGQNFVLYNDGTKFASSTDPGASSTPTSK